MVLIRKRILMVLLLYLLFMLVFTPAVSAVEDNRRFVCLKSEHCWKDPNSCSPAAKGNGHKARLTAKPGFEPIPGNPTYIIECIATANDQKCTTGNATADTQLYGQPIVPIMNDVLGGYTFEGLFKGNGTTASPNPTVWEGAYEWGDSTPIGYSRRWYAMNFYDPLLFDAEGTGGQQQGTFDFETAERDCVSIAWDPYGRVFDAATLEPVGGSQVTLFVKKGESFVQMTPADLVGGALINPQTVKEDGNFSFVVPDGDYKLSVAPPAVGDVAQVHVNYAKAYFEIYPALTGDVIQQRGAVQHRDIPVNASYSATPKMMEFFYDVNDAGIVTIDGRVSHPLSKIIAGSAKVYGSDPNKKVPYRTVGVFYADKWGKFKMELDQSKFEKTEEYTEIFSDVEIQKVDLRENTVVRSPGSAVTARLMRFVEKLLAKIGVYAQAKSTIIRFEPIPQYLEGYAYDSNNKLMPNATVGVYLTYSLKPYSKTVADANGYFRFTSESLPSSAYTIKYTTPSGISVTASTSKFIAQNQKYLAKNKINPLIGKDRNSVSAAVSAPSGAVNAPAGTNTANPSRSGNDPVKRGGFSYGGGSSRSFASSSNTQTSANPLILAFILIIILLGGVGAGVLLYMKNKQPSVQQW